MPEFPPEPKGPRGWWRRLRCVPFFVMDPPLPMAYGVMKSGHWENKHDWRPDGFADWRCARCGCAR